MVEACGGVAEPPGAHAGVGVGDAAPAPRPVGGGADVMAEVRLEKTKISKKISCICVMLMSNDMLMLWEVQDHALCQSVMLGFSEMEGHACVSDQMSCGGCEKC